MVWRIHGAQRSASLHRYPTSQILWPHDFDLKPFATGMAPRESDPCTSCRHGPVHAISGAGYPLSLLLSDYRHSVFRLAHSLGVSHRCAHHVFRTVSMAELTFFQWPSPSRQKTIYGIVLNSTYPDGVSNYRPAAASCQRRALSSFPPPR